MKADDDDGDDEEESDEDMSEVASALPKVAHWKSDRQLNKEMEWIVLGLGRAVVESALMRAAARVVIGRPVRCLSLGALVWEIRVENEGTGAALDSGPSSDVTKSFDLALDLKLGGLHREAGRGGSERRKGCTRSARRRDRGGSSGRRGGR